MSLLKVLPLAFEVSSVGLLVELLEQSVKSQELLEKVLRASLLMKSFSRSDEKQSNEGEIMIILL